MMRSETTGALAAALAKAQRAMEGAKKDGWNPFYKSKYAELASVWDACREPLTANGLAVVQTTNADGDGLIVIIETTLLHESGEWIAGSLALVPAKPDDPQSVGSAITYGRRYGLAAMVGVCPEDDDGEAATGRAKPPQQPKPGEKATPKSSKYPNREKINAALHDNYDHETIHAHAMKMGAESVATLDVGQLLTIRHHLDAVAVGSKPCSACATSGAQGDATERKGKGTQTTTPKPENPATGLKTPVTGEAQYAKLVAEYATHTPSELAEAIRDLCQNVPDSIPQAEIVCGGSWPKLDPDGQRLFAAVLHSDYMAAQE